MVMLTWSIFKEKLGHVGFLTWTKILCPHAMKIIRTQNGAQFRNQNNEYLSPYYSMEKYIITYCEDINLVPLEDSLIVHTEIMERETPHPYVDPRKSK